MSFDPVKWKDLEFGNPTRYEMANDLIRNRSLIGRSRAEILTMLGKPTSNLSVESQFLCYGLVHQHDFPTKSIFLPGPHFFNLEDWVLEVEFEFERVKSAQIRGS